ncbi:MAG: DUF4215 domain-containing protein [Kofleriaceae bacterium]
MRIVVVIAMASALVGCMFEEKDPLFDADCGDGVVEGFELCDDGNATSQDGCAASCWPEQLVRTTWTLRGATDSQPCPPGFGTAMVRLQRYSGDLDACVRLGECDGTFEPAIADTFSCGSGRGPIFLPDPSDFEGDYLASVAITTSDGSEIYATSLPKTVSIQQRGVDPVPVEAPIEILIDRGYLRVHWGVFAEQTDPDIRTEGCQLSVATFRVTATPSDGGAPITHAFDCQDLGAILTLPPGTYTVEVTGGTGLRYGSAEPFTDVVVRAPNILTDLGTAVILLPPPAPPD